MSSKNLFEKKLHQKRKWLGKKGQAELSETLLVLLVIVFLIVSGIFVYYMFFYRSLGNISSGKGDLDNLIFLYTFASSPEVRCENEDCVDIVKLFGFKELIKENKGYYISKFGKKKIFFENVYPELNENARKTECDLEKYQQSSFPNNCGFFIIFDNLNTSKGASVSLPVSLFFANLNEYSIGVLRVQYES